MQEELNIADIQFVLLVLTCKGCWMGRSGAELGSYAAGLLLGVVGQYPKTLVYTRAVIIAADASASDSSIGSLISGLKTIPWYVRQARIESYVLLLLH